MGKLRRERRLLLTITSLVGVDWGDLLAISQKTGIRKFEIRVYDWLSRKVTAKHSLSLGDVSDLAVVENLHRKEEWL